jgi:group II intron reverse transcriptase/maturase
MHADGKSDRLVVPGKSPNNEPDASGTAEATEERRRAEGNPNESTRDRTQNRDSLQQALERVREVATRENGVRFTTIWHHVYNVERLREAYLGLKRTSAPGIDGETWRAYGAELEKNLQDLSERLKRGSYRAKPVRRVYIPKADGRQRPIGVPVLEDKIVQRSTVEVLNAVYEADFLGFSYGFRPRRSQHHALDALATGLTTRKVNYVLDADIRGFFDNIDHEWLIQFIEHRIADERVVRHIRKWLNAGVLEDEEVRRVDVGTPQGGSISPLLANVYLHYVFDLWVNRWRGRQASGDMIVVRYADDFVVGFEHRENAERFLNDLRERFRQFKLELHPDKTRLIEFGRFAIERHERRGDGKPATFDFLGFTHLYARDRKGAPRLKRITARKKLVAKMAELRVEIRKRTFKSWKEVGKWLATVLTGHYRYYGVPGNYDAMAAFRARVTEAWRRALRRLSQRTRMTWTRMRNLADRWLPRPTITHLHPEKRFAVNTRGKSPVR